MKTVWEKLDKDGVKAVMDFNEEYRQFLTKSKTERTFVTNTEAFALENGFKSFDSFQELKAGDRVYVVNRKKNIMMLVVGEEPMNKGVNVLGAHIDSPRMDLKQKPLYEKDGIAFFDTHYYGGIKKYQWTTIPLAIHGVIFTKSGEKITVKIGEDDSDPVFVITDLLPHLAKDQASKKLSEAIPGEKLDLAIGNIPAIKDNGEEEKDAVKLNILRILNKKYGITEEDFISSELEIVPAFKARSAGFDESMVAGYGQDDKVCVYTSLRAILNVNNPKKTAICLFSDKEEIGSMGNTGMESNVFATFVAELLNKLGINRPNLLDKVFCNSKMLSADVDAGVDPLYSDVSDMDNGGFMGHGMSLNKYTGSGGKYNASDANAEFVSEIRTLFNNNNIKFQITELGKVDVGGGGTIAYILANRGVDVIDCGVPVLSMHSPYELTSKYDVYTAYRGYLAFFNN